MTIETITKLLYIWLSISLVFPTFAFIITYKYKKLKKTLQKQDMANRYYEEMLYASKDGYLTYSKYKNKTFEYCSRRLATFLNLKKGEDSSASDVFSLFSNDYKDKLNQHFNLLISNGIGFELIAKTKNDKTL